MSIILSYFFPFAYYFYNFNTSNIFHLILIDTNAIILILIFEIVDRLTQPCTWLHFDKPKWLVQKNKNDFKVSKYDIVGTSFF